MSQLSESLAASLRAHSSRLADMYIGAWAVLSDDANPDRIALAAHAMRELMEKGQRELAVTVRAAAPGTGRTRAAFDRLNALCQQARQESPSYRTRSGEIDQIVAKVLEAAEELVALHNQERPGRAVQREDLIRRLDPLGAALPAELVADWVVRWESWDSFFQLASHHQTAPSAEEMASAISEFSDFLIERLEPGPSRARDDIERLIREAEGQ